VVSGKLPSNEMKKLTLAFVGLLASLTISQAEIGDTLKEVSNYSNMWEHIQFRGCPALQFKSTATGNETVIFSPKTNREIAIIFDSRQRLSTDEVVKPWNSYGRWQLVQDDPKMATWHLKHPRFGDLWMVITANVHVGIIATPEGLETLGLHAAKVPREKTSTQ
jgi:hypothetical protein